MTENFELPVTYKNKEWVLPAEFRRMGYSYQIALEMEGKEILFEPDEERNFRARVNPAEWEGAAPATEWIQAVAEALELAFK